MVFGLIGLAMVIAIGSNSGGSKSTQQPSCASDWRLCSDNADVANHYSDYSYAEASCKIEAEKRAKYGSPKWPWLAFGSFLNGTSAKTTGLITLIEKDAQFQNGFGAMAHSTVTCTFDLNTRQVTNVSVSTN